LANTASKRCGVARKKRNNVDAMRTLTNVYEHVNSGIRPCKHNPKLISIILKSKVWKPFELCAPGLLPLVFWQTLNTTIPQHRTVERHMQHSS
jgi:hypothetical protein